MDDIIEVRFTKDQIVNSKKFSLNKEVLIYLLDDTRRYKITEVNEIINKFFRKEYI